MRSGLAFLVAALLVASVVVPVSVGPAPAFGQEPMATATQEPIATATAGVATFTPVPTAPPTATVGTPAPNAPMLTALTPNSVSAVGPGPFAVSVTGANFAPGAVLSLDGRTLQTTFASGSALTAVIPAGLPGGSYSATVTNPGGLSSAPQPNAFTVTDLSSVLYVPLASKRSTDTATVIFVQNLAIGSSTIYVRYYDTNGTSDPTWTHSVQVSAGASAIFDTGAEAYLPFGFDGSAVIQSTGAIAAVVNHASSSGSIAAVPGDVRAAQTRASSGAFSVSTARPTQATVPVVFGGYNGYWTNLGVQNTGRSTATFTISLYQTGAVSPSATIQRAIPAMAAVRVRLGPENGVPANFVGTAAVTSANTLSAVAETVHGETNVAFSYGAIGGGATTVNTPLLFKNFNGWVTGAQVVNVSSANVVVDATFLGRDTAISFGLPSRTLLPNESYTYYLPAIPDIPDGFVGAGVFRSTGPIAVVVQELNAESGAGMAYTGFSSGTPSLSVPVVYKDWNGWASGVQVQNLGATPAVVTIRYFLPAGTTTVDAGEIEAGESITFYQPANANLPGGLVGSATVSSTGGQPIIAIVNEVNYNNPGDGSMVYEGINY